MLDGSEQQIVIESVVCFLYFVIALLALVRAISLRKPPREMNFVFFTATVVHCFFRISQQATQSYFGEQENSTYTILTLVPSITFQTTLYVYLRVWELQCETLDAARTSPTTPIPTVWIVLWYSAWLIAVVSDIATNGHKWYVTFLFNILNYYAISFGFLYLGGNIRSSMDATFGASSNTFERHVTRVKWFFGCGCVARATFCILQVRNPSMLSERFTVPAYLVAVEMLPLAAAILSIYWVRQFGSESDYGSVASVSPRHQGALGFTQGNVRK